MATIQEPESREAREEDQRVQGGDSRRQVLPQGAATLRFGIGGFQALGEATRIAPAVVELVGEGVDVLALEEHHAQGLARAPVFLEDRECRLEETLDAL